VVPEIIGGVAVLGAAASVYAYGARAPQSQLFGPSFCGRPGSSKQLALTYDDGPNDPHTLRLLDVLDKHGTKATFFMIGRYVKERPQIAREVAARGHVVGNHTWSHPDLMFTGKAELRRQLEQTEQALTDAVGAHSKLFRPPFGARRPVTLKVARALGLEPIMWSVTCWDWSAKSADSIVKKAARQIRGGDVILLHDGGHKQLGTDRSHTVCATDELLRRYKGAGFEFVTIPEMQSSAIGSRSPAV
jgi:peptidoglycan/xylan/chitin deacetylase (PgdA/CDA1 family)